VRAFLKCGDLHQGFARVRCPDCQHPLSLVRCPLQLTNDHSRRASSWSRGYCRGPLDDRS
jgi:hypothetical protein